MVNSGKSLIEVIGLVWLVISVLLINDYFGYCQGDSSHLDDDKVNWEINQQQQQHHHHHQMARFRNAETNERTSFCHQTRLSSIFHFDDSVYFKLMNICWKWNSKMDYPLPDPRILQMFYFYLRPDMEDQKSYVYEGFTGFMISGDFLGLANTGLLTSMMRPYALVLYREKAGHSISKCGRANDGLFNTSCTELIQFANEIKNFTNKAFYFIPEHKQLLFCFENRIGAYKVHIYKHSISRAQELPYPEPYGIIKGFFRENDTIYFLTDKLMGTYNPESHTFKSLPFKNPLVEILTRFGCSKKDPIEFNLEETNRLTAIFSEVFLVLNIMLLVSACSLKAITKSKRKQLKRNMRSR